MTAAVPWSVLEAVIARHYPKERPQGQATVAESGYPGFEAVSWFALLAPRGTPAPMLSKLHQELSTIAAVSDIREKFAQLGLDTIVSSPGETRHRYQIRYRQMG
jgi:tripartite-type tricarboxylate transporter receptor subunit TctC